MDPLIGGSLLKLGGSLIDKLFPDEEKKAAALLELRKLDQAGELESLKIQMSAILAEAQSADPWTSRARPSFMWVMYILILASIPMGILSYFRPDAAIAVAAGMKHWLDAIPDDLWTVFGVGYLGYTGARSFERTRSPRKSS
jgi:hypothetical protein